MTRGLRPQRFGVRHGEEVGGSAPNTGHTFPHGLIDSVTSIFGPIYNWLLWCLALRGLLAPWGGSDMDLAYGGFWPSGEDLVLAHGGWPSGEGGTSL